MPVAVGHAAVAVAGLADSGLVFRLTRGRLWIGLLTALLVGIVALNVMALSFSASATRLGQQADVLDRQNSALRAADREWPLQRPRPEGGDERSATWCPSRG